MQHAKKKQPATRQRTQAPPTKPDAKHGKKHPRTPHRDHEQPPPDYQRLFEELVARANSGDPDALVRLRKFLDVNPYLWQRAGDLTAIAESAWIDLVAGKNKLVVESVKRQLVELKGELKGPHPTKLESLLVDQIAVTWVGAQHGEMQAASQAGGSLQHAAFRLKRAESAQKRYLSAVKTLTMLRAFMAKGLAPLHPVRLFDAERQQA